MSTQTYDTTNYELAEIGTRLAAWFIDGAILFIIESAGFLPHEKPVLVRDSLSVWPTPGFS